MLTVEDYIKIKYSEDKSDIEKVIDYNKALVNKYPWLQIRNNQDELVNDFTSTLLDDMPDGWRIAFGSSLCEEINKELIKNNLVEDYRVLQIKEKYGVLRWYDFNSTSSISSIKHKYEDISSKTCIYCGEKAKWLTIDYILPFCDKCKDKFNEDIYDSFKEIVYKS